MPAVKPKNIDEYISAFPEDIQARMEAIRKEIKKAAPKAEETIKYDIPTFIFNGNMIHFAGYKKHIGVYPAPKGDTDFNEELKPYLANRSTVQFPHDKPIPLKLLNKAVKFRIKNMETEAKKK